MLPESRFDGPDDSPGFLLWRVAAEWQRCQRDALETLGLTHVQFVLLAGTSWLNREGALISQAELARYVHTDEMMTSQVLRTLESRGLLVRTPHPDDQRSKCIKLTPAGRKLLKASLPLVETVDVQFFRLTQNELSSMLIGFKKLLSANDLSSNS
jgi:DNA-binding MarR family transcriptional regulator